MNGIMNNPSSPTHPINNPGINNRGSAVKDDAISRQVSDTISNLSTFQEIIILFVIFASLTLLMIYVIKKFSF